MNQLETNLVLWAICSIILFELLCIICLCRWCFNRIKPKRFYVKREEYEYLRDGSGTPSKFQSTILRPPHADELAVVGTIREQDSSTTFDNGIQNLGFYREDEDSFTPVVPSSPSQNLNWIELRSPLPINNEIIRTAQLLPTDYEVRSYPTDDYLYTRQPSPPRPSITDFRRYRDEYDDDDDDEELKNFRVHSLRRPEVTLSHIQRTDTSTESFNGNYSTLVPRSILKGSTSTTSPPPMDFLSLSHSQAQRSRTSSRFDESPRISVKINTDESLPVAYSTSAIERTIPFDSMISMNIPPSVSSLALNRMRFASVSKLNDVEWEVPSEFRTVVYDLNEDRQPSRGALIYNSDENLNNNNNNNINHQKKLSHRQRSQSAVEDQRTHVSRVFVPWDQKTKTVQPLYLSNDFEQGDITQQQAFEY